jgi:hypothetical protein
MKFRLYCTCGNSAVGTITPDAKAEWFKRECWDKLHTGPGHAPCDQRTAARVRAKEEAAGEAEVRRG